MSKPCQARTSCEFQQSNNIITGNISFLCIHCGRPKPGTPKKGWTRMEALGHE